MRGSSVPWLPSRSRQLDRRAGGGEGRGITDIRVHNAVRTDEETVRSIAGVSIANTCSRIRWTSCASVAHLRLVADVNVYWEPYQDGVRVNIVVKEKFPWVPLPTFSYSPGNISGGAIVAHGNLFGRASAE